MTALLVLAVLVAVGSLIYASRVRLDLAVARRVIDNLEKDEKVLIEKHLEIVDAHTATIRGQEKQLQQRGVRIAELENACHAKDEQIDDLGDALATSTHLLGQAGEEVLRLRGRDLPYLEDIRAGLPGVIAVE